MLYTQVGYPSVNSDGVRESIMEDIPAVHQDIRIQPRAPSDHVRDGLIPPPATMIPNVTLCAVRAGWPVVVEETRLRSQANVSPPPLGPFAEESQ